MKCSTHPAADASAVCIHCGRGLCSTCITRSASGRIVCSSPCASALQNTEKALNILRLKSVASLRWNGYLTLGSALVFAPFAFLSLRDGIWQLTVLMLPLAVIFAVSGVVFILLA